MEPFWARKHEESRMRTEVGSAVLFVWDMSKDHCLKLVGDNALQQLSAFRLDSA
jgi:hypothetical protein